MPNITGTSNFVNILAERGTTGLVHLVDEDLSFNGSHTIQSITGTLTINAFTLGGAITGNSQDITNLGTVLIGSATAYGRLGEILETNVSANYGGMALNTWSATGANASFVEFHRSKSATIGNYATVASGDAVGYISFRAADGTDWQDVCQLKVLTTGTIADNRIPGQLFVYLWSNAGPSVQTEVMNLTAAQIELGSAMVLAGAGTGANGIKLKNLKNATASALSGTQLDVEIDIGGTPYYFTVYPTKA